MKEWISEHKNIIFLVFIIFILFVTILFIFFGNSMKEENSIEEYNIAILSCSTKIEREGMIIEQNYDFYDNDVSQSRILVQRQEFKSKGEKYNEVFDIYVKMDQKNLTKNVNEKIKDGNNYIKLNVEKDKGYALFSITYEYTSSNSNEMYEIFNIDVYNENINTLKSLFESGGLECKRK